MQIWLVFIEISSFADDAAYVQGVYRSKASAESALMRWQRKHPKGVARVESYTVA